MRKAALAALIGWGLWLAAPGAGAASARTVPAASVAASGAVVTRGHPVRLRVRTRPARAVHVRVRAVRCGRRARLRAASGGARRAFGVRPGVRTLRWRVRLPAGRATVRLAVSRAGPGCRVAVRRLRLAEVVVLGAALAEGRLGDARYAQAAGRFTGVTPENAMKMEVVQARKNRYAFDAADRVVAFAEAHGQPVHGHPLVWGGQLPVWLHGPTLALGRSREQLRAVLRRHIQAVVGRYRGRVASWDVVNEAVAADGSLRRNVWLDGIGPGYLEDAFRWAHEADPGARLFYNEVGIELANPQSDAVLRLLTDLRARGVPVHGAGFQAHLATEEPPAAAALAANLRRFTAAGLDVAFSELDVATGGRRDRFTAVRQAAIFRTVARVCAAMVRCGRVTVWGVSDHDSWQGERQAALPIDAAYRPKPAWCELVRRLTARAGGRACRPARAR